MKLNESKWICDICGRNVEYNANNKRKCLVIRENGLILQEESIGDLCEKCRSLIQGTLGSFLEIIKEESLRED